MFDVIPPSYIPPSFPRGRNANHFLRRSPTEFFPPSYIAPSFRPGRNANHFFERNPPFIPPFFPRLRQPYNPFFRRNFPFFIPPRMGAWPARYQLTHFMPRHIFPKHIKNQKIAGQLEKVEIKKEILDKIDIKQCNICLDEYKIGDEISYLPCFHYFHYNCIKDWILKSEKCPLCNSIIKFE